MEQQRDLMMLEIRSELTELHREIAQLVESLNKLKVLERLPITSEANKQLLRQAEDVGVAHSHVVIFISFIHLTLNLLDAKSSKEILREFITIPKKKEQNFKDSKVQHWIMVQLAKNFYKPFNKLKNKGDFKYLSSNLYFYHHMVFILTAFLDNDKKRNELYEEHVKMIEDKDYMWVTRFLMVLLLITEKSLDTVLDFIAKIHESNSASNFMYYINDDIKAFTMFLVKYGKNQVMVDFNEEFVEMADNTVRENLENIVKERDEYSKIVSDYEMKISELEKENNKLRSQLNIIQIENSTLKDYPILTNLKVLVIGDTGRKTEYKKIIEKHGGHFSFLDGIDEAHKAGHEANKADLILHIVAYSKHTATRQIEEMNNVVPVNRAGLGHVEEAINNLKKKHFNKSV